MSRPFSWAMRDQTREFFGALYADKPAEAVVCVWRLEGRRSEWFTDIDQAAAYAIENFEHDLYAQIGIGQEARGPHYRLDAEHVIGLGALWMDFDIEGSAHQKKNLPRTVTEALTMLPRDLPPSMIVASGFGAHAYWLLKEMALFADASERRRAARLLKLWERLIRLRAQSKGWTIDAVHDLARILRIPGTKNNKLRDQGIVADCSLIDLNDRRYNLSEFEEALAGVPGLTDDPEVAAHGVAIPKPATGDLILAPDRKFAKLSGAMRNHDFAVIWNHARRNLSDSSQSGYDLALANILFKAGLSDQDIVDAMIHNRSEHGKQTKLRLDYFQRTLAKARSQAHGGYTAEDVANATENGFAPAATTTSGSAATTEGTAACAAPAIELTPEAKGIMYEKLSCLLNLRDAEEQPNILRVVKVTGTKPTWRFDLKTGGSVTIKEPEGVIRPDKMRCAIFAATNRIMPTYEKSGWGAVLEEIRSSIVEIPAGMESTATGELHYYLEQYLTASGIRDSPADALGDVHAILRPFEFNRRIAIHAGEFRDWVFRCQGEKIETPDLLNRLSAIGATAIEFDIEEGRARQSRWLLPATFDPLTWRRISIEAHAASSEAARKARIIQ